MADLVLDWGLFGAYGTNLGASQTVDTGGVEVTVDFAQQDEDAQAFTFNADGHVAPDDPFAANSFLKLYGAGGEGGIDDTSTTSISFASSDEMFGDEVQDVSFRINDIDVGRDELDDPSPNHVDILDITAYDGEGNEVPVSIDFGSDTDPSGPGGVQGGDDAWQPTDGQASALVTIDGPVSRIVIDYNNSDEGEQIVTLTDLHFSTTDADGGPNYIVEGTEDDDLIDIDYDGDPEGDRIDNNDARDGSNDDVVEAGGGDDTVRSGEGSDTVDGGEGDDDIDTRGTVPPAIDVSTFPGVPVDADPENERDLVLGGDGNDTITTGDDRDTIHGEAGDDVIEAGIDDDEVYGGTGNDSITDLQGSDMIEGGDGDDTIIAGIDTFSDYEGDDPNLPIGSILSDPNTTDGMDTVYGGAGNDWIETGDDADYIEGGAGADTIAGGIDDDTILGGAGDDSLLGGHGSDSVLGGDGDDYIDASAATSGMDFPNEPDATDPVPDNDRDYVEGGAGNDTILTGDDDDTIMGGAGDDVIDAGIDDDLVSGGDGDDTITGGEGADTLSGEAGRDVFLGGNVGDEVDGGSAPDGVNPDDGLPFDYDTLDLRGTAPEGGRLAVTYTSEDREDGFVEYFDADDNNLGQLEFTEIENVVPCFTPGTTIATPKGERMVEDLKAGDKIITRDNGIQEIRWIGTRTLTGHELARAPNLRPILIQKGSLGHNLPEHDILVSPQHRMLLTGDKTQLYFEETEVLAAAKHLTAMPGIDEVGTLGVTYVHFMFDHHEVVLSNGAWSESFQPGANVLDGLGLEQRDEILQLFPELTTAEGLDDYAAARRALKKHEARLLAR